MTAQPPAQDGPPAPDDARPPAEAAPAAMPAVTRRNRRVAWIWIIPVVAALVGLSLVLRAWILKGPEITISFRTAEGLEVGKTQVRYKDVVVGTVRSIQFNDDRSRVLVRAELSRDGAGLANDGSRFWVVRPRLGISGVSGLGTLLSGAYIEVDTADANGERRQQLEFEGLETPPEVTHDRPGTRYTLRADTLGSLDIGSPVYYRRIPVGRVIGYELDESGRYVRLQIFVDAPNDRFVTRDVRFWNASGVDLSLNAGGLTLRTQSLISVAAGGVAFAPMSSGAGRAAPDQAFMLYPGEHEARAEPDGTALRVRLRFDQSVRGLSPGAPVDFRGVDLGEVTAVTMDFDPATRRFYALVDANLYPERLGPAYEKVRRANGTQQEARPGLGLIRSMVANGLRAQLRPGNLLTGQLYVALDRFPKAPAEGIEVDGDPVPIPTVPGNLDQLQHQITSIVDKIDKIPFERIGAELRSTLENTTRLLERLDREVAPEARDTLRQARQSLAEVGALVGENSELPENAGQAMRELARAARSLRVLSDYLQANPQALVRGRAPDALPGDRP